MAWTTAGNIRGPVGPAGADGAPGAPGPAGPEGPQGPVGVSGVVWRGEWRAATTYAPTDAVLYSGTAYIATDPPSASGVPPVPDVAVPHTTNPGWMVLALEGAQGPTGPAGAAGAAGATGPAGADGAPGAPGATGTRGSQWYVGTGVPTATNTSGAIPGDKYLDQSTGDVYSLS